MPARLPDSIKSLVIQQWLEGKPRNDIADNGLSDGAVTNIVNEWKHNLGFSLADDLRELAVTMKRVGVTASQCALGSRVAMIMLNMGVKEDDFESYILDIYNRCKDLGLSPENIASQLKDLLEFSTTYAIPFSQIPNYVKQKADEKQKLEEETKKLKGQIEMLTLEKSDRQFLRDQALQDERMTATGLRWYSDINAELRKYGIPVDDLPKFAKAVNGIRQYGYDAGKVISEFLDNESHVTRHQMLQRSVKMLKSELNYLSQQYSSAQNTLNSYSPTISALKELETMGFGVKELKLLGHTINEIAVANNMPLNKAQQKFFKDIEEQYDKKLGFESKVQSIQLEINKLSEQNIRLPLVGPLLARQNQSIVALSTYSKQIAEFYFASAAALFRKEVKRLVLIARI